MCQERASGLSAQEALVSGIIITQFLKFWIKAVQCPEFIPQIARFPGFVDIFEDVGILQATVGPLNKPNSI